MAMCCHCRGLFCPRCSMWGWSPHQFRQGACPCLSFVYGQSTVRQLHAGACHQGVAPQHWCTRFLSCVLHSTTIVDGRGFCAFPFRKTIFSEPSMGLLCIISVTGRGLTVNTRIVGQWLTMNTRIMG